MRTLEIQVIPYRCRKWRTTCKSNPNPGTGNGLGLISRARLEHEFSRDHGKHPRRRTRVVEVSVSGGDLPVTTERVVWDSEDTP